MSAKNKEHEVQAIHPLHQKASGSIALAEFFPKGFFDKVVVTMTSYSEFDEDNEETNEEQSAPLKRDKVIIVLEALPVHVAWHQNFHLWEDMHEQIVVTIHHTKLYTDKVKDVPLTRSPTQYATCNTAVIFTDDNLLLGSKPHNCPLFVTGYIRGQMVKWILVDGSSAVNII